MKYSLKYDKKNGQLLDLELVPEKYENPLQSSIVL